MNAKGWAITLGVGAAAGAVAVMMMPKTNPARRLAAQAARTVEDTAVKMTDRLTDTLEQMTQ